MTKAEMKKVADECELIARTMADKQDSQFVLEPRQVQRVVSACISSANTFKYIIEHGMWPGDHRVTPTQEKKDALPERT